MIFNELVLLIIVMCGVASDNIIINEYWWWADISSQKNTWICMTYTLYCFYSLIVLLLLLHGEIKCICVTANLWNCPFRELNSLVAQFVKLACAYAQFMNLANCLSISWIGQLKICPVHELGKLCEFVYTRKIISRTRSTPVDWLGILTAQFVKWALQIAVLTEKSVTCNAGNVIFSWQRVLKATYLCCTHIKHSATKLDQQHKMSKQHQQIEHTRRQ